MNKFPLLAFLAFFFYALSVNAAPGFNVVNDFVNITSQAGSTASGSFAVNNTGTTELNINFTGYTLEKGGEKLSITSLNNITNMGNGTSQVGAFSVTIPKQQSPGLYVGTLTAASNSSATDTVGIRLNVTEKYDVGFTPSVISLGSAILNSTHTDKAFSVTNTGNADLTNVTFGFSKSGFSLKSNKTNFVLPFNKTESISFNITIPTSSSTGNVTLGNIKLSSTELSKDLSGITAQIGGGLEIEDLDVFLTTRPKRGPDGILRTKNGADTNVPDGRKLNFGQENIGPGSELRFNFIIENTFTDKDNIDINDITVRVTILEMDDGDDIEDESKEFDLDAKANEEVDIIIKIPLAVDVGVYEILIEVEGEDDSGNSHSDEMELKLDIDKEPRDIAVERASLFPETVKCSGTSTLTATIRNIGSRIESGAMIEIVNGDLGINFAKKNIELEDDPFDGDNSFTQSIIVAVDKGIKAGTYPIEVRSYLQEDALWEKNTVDLEVGACSSPQPDERIPEEAEINETEPVEMLRGPAEEPTGSESIPVLGPATTEVPLIQRPSFWAVVVILNALVIGSVIFFAVKAAGKSNKS